MARDKYAEYITKHLQELARVRQAKIDRALRTDHHPGFARDGRVCLVEKKG